MSERGQQCTNLLELGEHAHKAARIQVAVKNLTSAEGRMMQGSCNRKRISAGPRNKREGSHTFPPSSSNTGVPTSAPLSATFWPICSEPICEEVPVGVSYNEQSKQKAYESDMLDPRIASERLDGVRKASHDLD